MAQREETQEIELGFDGKPLKPAFFLTGQTHRIHFKVPVLQLNRQYHDEAPVAGADFEVELEDGSIIRGNLDDYGQAQVSGMPARPVRVRYGLDPRPYTIVDDGTNPAYIAHFTKSDADSLADPAGRRGHHPDDALAFGLEAVDWIWGTAQGGFNEKQTVSQIIVDAFIGMIPLVGEVTAVRDLVALILGMSRDPKRRESKLEWLTLVVLLFALIPVIGGAIKGVGKLLLKGAKEGAEGSKELLEIVAILNRVGMGDALKWLRELKLEAHTGELLGRWRELTHRLIMVLDSIQSKLKGAIPAWMLAYVGKLKPHIQELAQQGETMIPEAVKELNERLKAAQRHLYQGEWNAIPKNLRSNTREVEARLVDVPGGKKWEEWREGLAVLDSWNKDGYYVELTVPDSGLWAWEGKAASQIENSPKAPDTQGQYLPGGHIQLFIDMAHPPNAMALNEHARKLDLPLEKILERKPTEWTDSYNGLHVPEKNAEAAFLGPFEVESKNRLKATVLEKSIRDRNKEEK